MQNTINFLQAVSTINDLIVKSATDIGLTGVKLNLSPDMINKSILILNNCTKRLTDIINVDKRCNNDIPAVAEKRCPSVAEIFHNIKSNTRFDKIFSTILDVPTTQFIHRYFVIDDKQIVWLLLYNKNHIYDNTYKKLTKYCLDEETIKKIKDDPSNSVEQQCILSIIMNDTTSIKTKGDIIHAILDVDKLNHETEILEYITHEELKGLENYVLDVDITEDITAVDDNESVLSDDDVNKTSDNETWMVEQTLKALFEDDSHDESVSVNTDDEFTPPSSWKWSTKYKKYADTEGNIYYRDGKKMEPIMSTGLWPGLTVFDADYISKCSVQKRRIRAVDIVVDAFELCDAKMGVDVIYKDNDSSNISPANLICEDPHKSTICVKTDYEREERVKSALKYICSHKFNMIKMETEGYGCEKASFIRMILSTMKNNARYYQFHKFRDKYIRNCKAVCQGNPIINLLTTDETNEFVKVSDGNVLLYKDNGEGRLTAILNKTEVETLIGVIYKPSNVLYDTKSDMYIKHFNGKTVICAKRKNKYIPFVHDVENTRNETVYFNNKNWNISDILTRAGYHIIYKTN